MKVLTNAFSINMLADPDKTVGINMPINKEDIPKDVESAIGHSDTASVVSTELGFDIPANRITLQLTPEDEVYVAQYIGPRLPEGSTTLPEGAIIKYYRIYIKKTYDFGKKCLECSALCGPCFSHCTSIC